MTVRPSNELSHSLLELGPDATVVVDDRGAIIFANAQVARTFGYSPDELAGRSIEVLLPERFHGAHKEHRARFALRPRPRAMGEGLMLFGRHKDGHEFPVEISLSPVQSGDGPLVVAAVRDATVRRDTEQVLIEANRAKSRLLAAASDRFETAAPALMRPVCTTARKSRSAARSTWPSEIAAPA